MFFNSFFYYHIFKRQYNSNFKPNLFSILLYLSPMIWGDVRLISYHFPIGPILRPIALSLTSKFFVFIREKPNQVLCFSFVQHSVQIPLHAFQTQMIIFPRFLYSRFEVGNILPTSSMRLFLFFEFSIVIFHL